TSAATPLATARVRRRAPGRPAGENRAGGLRQNSGPFTKVPGQDMKTLGINVPCLVNPRRTAVVDSSMRLVIGHDLFYFAGPRERERFVKDPLRYCRRLTDPVTLRRFEPRRTSPKLEYHGRMYYFAGDSTLGCSEPRPTASPCARECDGEPRPGTYHQDEGLEAGAWMSIDPRIASAFETDNG